MPRIFISYRRADSEAVTGRIHDRLVREFGFDNVFLDVETGNIPTGEDFRAVLRNAVGKCDVLLAIIGPKWLDIHENDNPELRRLDNPDDFVRIEVATGLEREQTDGTLIIPVLIGNASMPTAKDLPDVLQEIAFRNAQVVRGNPDFHKDVTILIDRLNAHFKMLDQSVVEFSRPKQILSRSKLVIGIITLVVVIPLIVIIISRLPMRLSPVEIANQRLTQTAIIQIASANTQSAEGTISGIMTQIANESYAKSTALGTLTADAYTDTPTTTPTQSNTPTENATITAQAQATLNAQLTAQVPTNTPPPTGTQTPTPSITPSLTDTAIPTVTQTPNIEATQTSDAIQLATAQQNARMTQSAQSTQQAFITPIAEVTSENTPKWPIVTVLKSANLRNGPGTNYSKVGSAAQDDNFAVIARNANQQDVWYLVSSNDAKQVWISSSLVNLIPSEAQIEIAATIPSPPTNIPLPSNSADHSIPFNITSEFTPDNMNIEQIYTFRVTTSARIHIECSGNPVTPAVYLSWTPPNTPQGDHSNGGGSGHSMEAFFEQGVYSLKIYANSYVGAFSYEDPRITHTFTCSIYKVPT